MEHISWEKFKPIVEAKNLSIQKLDRGDSLELTAVDGAFQIGCTLIRSLHLSAIEDYETNFMPTENETIDGAFSFGSLGWMKAQFRDGFLHSWAADMGPGPDYTQALSGNDWTPLEGFHKLWDFSNDLDENGEIFTINKMGVYSMDIQLRLADVENATAVEIAVFKKVSGQPDDYWFILARKEFSGTQASLQMSGATQFDFRKDEQYYIAIKLEGTGATATLSGNDDYTAWGCSWIMPLVG